MEECRDYSQLHCTEETDSDNFYYDAEEGRQVTGPAYVSNVELINIDCLTPEHIKHEQNQQPEIRMIKQWKSDSEKPLK